MPALLLAHLNRPVFALGSLYTLRRLVELDSKWFAVVTNDGGAHEIHVGCDWVYPVA